LTILKFWGWRCPDLRHGREGFRGRGIWQGGSFAFLAFRFACQLKPGETRSAFLYGELGSDGGGERARGKFGTGRRLALQGGAMGAGTKKPSVFAEGFLERGCGKIWVTKGCAGSRARSRSGFRIPTPGEILRSRN